MKNFKVSVVGLGKLGSSLSACFASKGYKVLGYDVNELSNFNIGIFALGSVPRKSEKKDRGEIAISIKIGGVQVDSGNWAYAEDNGVLVSKNSLKLD